MTEPADYGTPEAVCDQIGMMAGGVIAHASVVQLYAEAGFLPGLEFAARCTAAYLRQLDAALAELDRTKALIALRRSSENIGPGQGV